MTQHVLLITLFSILIATLPQRFARAEEPVRIITGSPSFGTRLEPKRADIEKAIGGTFEIKIAPTQASVKAMVSGLVDLLSIGTSPEEAWELAKKAGTKVDALDQYDAADLWIVKIKVALHPSNPVKEISKQQMNDILTGKIKTWEPITGEKTPISVIIARDYVGAMKSVQSYYLGGQPSPVAEQVVNKDGVFKRMKNDPGAISFFAFKDDQSEFKPKYLDTEAGHPSYLMIKKNGRPAARKLFDVIKAMAKPQA